MGRNMRPKIMFFRPLSIVVLLTAVLLLNIKPGIAQELILNHSAPVRLNSNRETPVILSVVGDRENIESAMLYYREIGQAGYNEIRYQRSEITSNDISFDLPAISDPTSGYEYYFSISHVSGREITYPQTNPQNNPLRIRPADRAQITGNILLLNTENTVQRGDDLVFAVSLFQIQDQIDINSVRLLLNNTEITRAANVSPPLIAYKISNPQPGTYNFQIRARTKTGERIQSQVWQFRALEGRSIMADLPFNLRGSISFNSRVRSVSEADESIEPVRASNDANLRLNLFARQDWFSTATRLYITSRETSRRQPSNRYSVQLSVPTLDLHLIDYSPNYGSFLLANRNIRGITGRFQTGGFSLSTTYGQSARAIDGKLENDDKDTPIYSSGTFQRDAFAAKLDLGENEGLKIGFGFSKIKDDISSLDSLYYRAAETDSVVYLETPADNLVLGTDLRLAFDNQRFVTGAEVAYSLYNSNIADGVMSKDSLEAYIDDDLPLDPEDWERFIVINKNMEPLIPGRSNLAYRLYLRWFVWNNMLNVSYSEIGSSFRSLGSSYSQSDASIITVSDYISLFRNRLSIDAGLNIVTDNLSDQKTTTTTNTSWYVQTMFRPRRDLPYFRTGVNFVNTENDYEADDMAKIEQEMGSYNFGIGYRFEQIPQATTSVDLSFNLSDDKDLTDRESFDLSRNSFNLNVHNSLSAIPLETRLNFSNSVHKDNIVKESESTNYTTFGLRNEYTFLDGLIVPHLDLSFNTFGEDNSLSRYDIGARVRPYTGTTVSTRIELANFSDKNNEDRDYSTFGWFLNASKRF